jgi:alkylation response protein AidB-like acyl-CoA dehydrogenase
VTDPAAGAAGISAFVVEKGDTGFSFGAPEHKLGIKGSPTRELYFDNCAVPADRQTGAEGSGFRSIWGHRAGSPEGIPADLAFLTSHVRSWLAG